MANLEGQTLKGRYRIDELIGRGGMAEVYKAWDMRRHYHVAVKVMREDLAEDIEFLQRFKREASALAALSHVNIVRFYSFEREGRLAFIVMDYVEGTTLRGRILDAEGMPLPLEEVAGVLRQMCAALYYAHGENVLHRDVKPGNIMIQPNGWILVADFGIAKAADAATATTVMPGTPAYMSPEQCRSEMLDERTDVYSLGVVTYEMLAGRRPFVGESDTAQTGSTRDKIRWEQMHAEPPPLQPFNPAVTAEIESAVFKAMAKDPEARWPTVLAFWEALEQALGVRIPEPAPAPVPERRPEPVEPEPAVVTADRGWRGRMGWIVAGAGALIVVVALLLAAVPRGQQVPDLRGRQLDVALAMLEGAGFEAGVPQTDGISSGELWVVGQEPGPGERQSKGGLVSVDVESRITAAPTPTLTPAPSRTSTPRPPTYTPTPSRTPKATSTYTPTPTPSRTRSPTPTRTRTPTRTPTPEPTPTWTATPKPKNTNVRSRDGMQMVKISAGDFVMGAASNDREANSDERPLHTVYLDTYWIDKYEVSMAQYNKCVSAGACPTSRFAGDGKLNGSEQPAVGVSWSNARAYCQWVGARLPTEAEWEKAARGTDGRLYPWGSSSPDCSKANYWREPSGCAANSAKVSNYSSGKSPYGIFNMAGNVWEWVNDWYGPNYYSSSPGQNPKGPSGGQQRVTRGGSWDDGPGGIRTANRHKEDPGSRYRDLGFRCASSSAP